jgi:ABC-type multidrug transport system ATPase subunit
MVNEIVIGAHSLAKAYGHGLKRVQAVRGIDLAVHRGELFGLVGPDGAGKTTTMQILCGILRPTAGAATVDGVDVVANPNALGGKVG